MGKGSVVMEYLRLRWNSNILDTGTQRVQNLNEIVRLDEESNELECN